MAYTNNDNQAMAKHLKGMGYVETKNPNVLVHRLSGTRATCNGGTWSNNYGDKSTDIHQGKNSKKMW
jgi:hypothetical protein